MQRSNLTNLLYVGYVDFKIKVNDRIVHVSRHNKGLPGLQRAFCNFLTGNSITHDDVPQFIDLRYSSTGMYDFDRDHTLLLNKLPLTGRSWEEGKYVYGDNEEESTYIAKLTAVLSSNSLIRKISNTESATTDFRFYLMSGSNGTINGVASGYFDLAYVDITAEALSLIGPGSQAIIEWSLQLLTGEGILTDE